MTTLETTAVSRPLSPDVLPGYRLEAVVGRGGMGEVHRAVQLSLGRPVAVKLLARELAEEEAFVTRFRKEAAALAALSHPNIVAVVDQGQVAGGVPFLVMEFVDGPSLREVMRAPLFDAASALHIFAEVARAISYAHGRGVIHRDLKPENVLFDEQAGGVAKVTDFGLAAFTEDGHTRFALTQTHMAMGTVAYMAPEQRVDAKNVDGRADIFALGVILYEMLTGEVPMGTFAPPSQLKPDLDARLDAVVERCLRPVPDERYPTVAAVLEALEPMLPAGRHTLPPRPTTGRRVRQALARAGRVAVRTAAGLVVLSAAGVLGVSALRARQEEGGAVATSALGDAALGTPVSLGVKGRAEEGARGRQVTLGTGPDLVTLLASGRQVQQEGEALLFPAAGRGEDGLGRAVLDTVDAEGESLEWVAQAQVATPEPDALGRVRRLLLGPPPPAAGGLLLMGDPGRFVSLVASEKEGEVRLEWALGERRGVQLAPTMLSAREGLRVELAISPAGELRAFLGADRNRRVVGEPLQLGEDWQRLFGRLPQPAAGCLEGVCRFSSLRYSVRRPAPPALQVPAVAVTPAVAAPQASAPPSPAVRQASVPPSAPRATSSTRSGTVSPARATGKTAPKRATSTTSTTAPRRR
jgi:hypothetical protein